MDDITQADAEHLFGDAAKPPAANGMSFAEFHRLYAESLCEAIDKYPDLYRWPRSEAPIVAAKMVAAIERGSFNYDSKGFKILCKKLGIKHTRTAIKAWYAGLR